MVYSLSRREQYEGGCLRISGGIIASQCALVLCVQVLRFILTPEPCPLKYLRYVDDKLTCQGSPSISRRIQCSRIHTYESHKSKAQSPLFTPLYQLQKGRPNPSPQFPNVIPQNPSQQLALLAA